MIIDHYGAVQHSADVINVRYIVDAQKNAVLFQMRLIRILKRRLTRGLISKTLGSGSVTDPQMQD